MKFNRQRISGAARPGRRAAFTLAEVLAAMAFMAIVIPVAIQGLHVASLAGTVAERKGEAARIAERVLNESIVTGSYQSAQNGTVIEGVRQFNWTLRNDAWNENPMRLVTVEVTYTAQGKEYSVKLSTLVDGTVTIPSLDTPMAMQ